MYLNNAKIIILKIGSSNLVDSKGKLKEKWLQSLAKDIKKLKKKGQGICHSIIWCYCLRQKLLKN